MYGFCEEIEIAREFETCKEIHAKWPHLVEAHLDSLHEDIQDRVRHKWQVHVGADRQRHEMQAIMAQAQQSVARESALHEMARMEHRQPPFSLTGLHLGCGL